MNERDWSTIRHFRKEEFVNDPDRVLWDTVVLLDQMRDDIQLPFVIHVAWDSADHLPDSSHYTDHTDYASAVDFHIKGLSLLDQWLWAERYPWNGIGLYPFWTSPGLHVDLRRLGRDHPSMGKRWWRNQSGIYHPIDKTLMQILVV